jgi:hypothetical protein
MRDRYWWIAGVLLLIMAGVYRFKQAHLYTLEWDEANLLAIAKLPHWQEVIEVMIKRDIHPPLQALLLHGWIGLFDDSDFWVRNYSWLLGMVGLIGTGLLAYEICRSLKAAAITMALTAFSPLLIHYTSITTYYSGFYAFSVFSWWSLLRFLNRQEESSSRKNRWLGLYFVFSASALYTTAAGPLLLLSQGGYLLYLWAKKEPLPIKRILSAFILLGLMYLPYFLYIQHPWHIARTLRAQYTVVPFFHFIYSPVNLLFLGYDVRDLHVSPDPLPSLFYGLLGFTLLFLSIRQLRQTNKPVWMLIFWLSFFPLISAYGISLVLGVGVFQFRTLIFSLFGLHLLIAHWLSHQKATLAAIILITIVGLQLYNPHKRPYWPDTGNILAANVKARFQPGDGIVIYPGWMYLVFMRYFDPDEFGLSDHERQFDPQKENYFSMPQRIDDRYFIVSGEKTLARPEIQQEFAEFQKKHRRIWLVSGYNQQIYDLLDCQRDYFVFAPNGSFHLGNCHKNP